MNTAILDQYNLIISKNSNGECDITGHWLSNYIYIFRSSSDVQDFIDDIELAINNQFSLIEDPDFSAGYFGGTSFSYYALITATSFEIWEISDPSEKLIIPLIDFKEILLSWKYCLDS